MCTTNIAASHKTRADCAIRSISPQVLRDQGKFIQRCLQVFDDLGGDYVGGGEIGCVFKAVVFEPEDVQAGFIAFDQLVIREGVKALGLLALVTILCFVAGYEVIQVLAAQRIRLQGEVFIGAEVVDPKLFGPWLFAGDSAVKEEHIRLTPWA
jgi:hypothetical protein